MSRFFKLLFLFSVVSIAIISHSCKKDKTITLVVTVKLTSDTNIVVPRATVELWQTKLIESGKTDSKGQYIKSFEQNAFLDIKASNDSLSGRGVISLYTYGETYYKTIFVN